MAGADLASLQHASAAEPPEVEVSSESDGSAETSDRSWIWGPIRLFVVSRLVTVCAAAVAVEIKGGQHLVDALAGAWDGGWYLGVARHGYPSVLPYADGELAQSTLGFFPLYPLAVRLVHWFGVPWSPAALTVTTVTGLVTAIILWRLLWRLRGERAAEQGVALFCFFPGAMVLSFGYSEGIMLACTTGCLYCLVSRRWFLAGLLAALAGAARPNGLVLAAVAAWAAAEAIRHRRDWRALAAPLLAPVGAAAFFVFLGWRTGAFDAYLRTQREGWDQRMDPLANLDVVWRFLQKPFDDVNVAVVTFGTLFLVIATGALLWRRYPAVLVVYAALVMAMAFLMPISGTRPRMLLTAFPLVTAFAEAIPRRMFPTVLGVSGALLGALTVLTVATPAATP